ncbi:MAG TPA: histidine kinase, partial [Thermoanaerobaculia bacterium]
MNDRSHRLSSKELLLIFIFWMSFATLGTINRLHDPRGFGFRGVSPAGPITMIYVEAALWTALTPPIFALSSRFSGRSGWGARLIVLFAAGVLITIGIHLVLHFIRSEIFQFGPPRARGFRFAIHSLGRLGFLNQFVVFGAVLAAGYAREYFLRDQRQQREAAELQRQLAEARLDALRMQMNPHFLFNTLHAISALVERDPAGVRRMIARLSELLRHTLDATSQEVTLRDEIQFLDRYLEIMEVRFEGRLKVSTSIARDVLAARVPNLILQPVVENAFEHGVGKLRDEGRVEIVARREGEVLLLSVSDNGPGMQRETEGVGLANTRARLAQMYGDRA